METKVKINELISILRENRGKHRTVFEASLDGYRMQALAILEEQVQALSQGRTPQISIIVTRPVDHTRDYDRIIKMLELDTREEIMLSETEAANYVMDDWRWKRDWLRMSSSYAAGATIANYGGEEVSES